MSRLKIITEKKSKPYMSLSPKKVANNKTLRRKRIWWAYLFILPQLLFFLVFTIYPIVMSYVYSVFDWPGIGPLDDFAGLENYTRVLKDPSFWNAFKNTFIYMAGVTLLLLPTSLLLAIALNNVLKKSSVFYRTIFFLPVVTTTAIVGIVMRKVFSSTGVLNEFLMAIGLIDEPHNWLGSPTSAMIILIVIGAWKFFGMMMVYWLAGLQTLPKDVLEAASMDGCNLWQKLRHVIVPILLPVAMVILLLCVSSSLHVFDLVLTLTGGGPYYSTDVVDLYIFRFAFNPDSGLPSMGYASAAGVVFGLAVFAVILLLGWLIRRTKQS
ncbi:carbohydrate ABC transporter membrane protein 1 (CUT1 family) [Scopulibacillus darangshiensis]|uniref:Carbohydrate ABC transporter membrane protein 1 (CUT1 family) n=1 Tax=Scopulibacillus darangshiensis TaxID=442528 RepID=A0A4R2NM22_9BACL|nr:sugar ABC transporter permease [Scopulibacillus darangshiensis]TCP22345.1 carbohydrate ABC transporter membrane protein 1 (CUT1 family) [Scopulibacillus darangshiensis]